MSDRFVSASRNIVSFNFFFVLQILRIPLRNHIPYASSACSSCDLSSRVKRDLVLCWMDGNRHFSFEGYVAGKTRGGKNVSHVIYNLVTIVFTSVF